MIPSREEPHAEHAESKAPRCYPRLMIGGVYRASFAKLQEGPGMTAYTLPGISPAASRHRARMRVRQSVHAMRQVLREQASRDETASMPCGCGVCTS